MKKMQLILVSLGVVLLAAGCGGGGGGTSGGTTIPTAAVQITPSNATAVSTTSMSSVNSLSGGAAVGSKGISPTGVVVTGASTIKSTGLVDIAAREIKSIYGSKLPAVPVGLVTGSGTPVLCAGGSGTRTWTVQDNNVNNIFDNGDSATVVFSSCLDAVGTRNNGTMSFTLNNITSDLMTGAMSFSATINFNQFSSVSTNSAVGTVGMTGDMTLTLNYDPAALSPIFTMSVLGNSFDMTSSVDGAFRMTNYNFTFDVNAGSIDITMTTASVGLNGMVKITTPIPLTDTGGSIRFTSAGVGANGSYVEIAPVGLGTYCTQTVFDGTNTTTTTPNPTCASLL